MSDPGCMHPRNGLIGFHFSNSRKANKDNLVLAITKAFYCLAALLEYFALSGSTEPSVFMLNRLLR